MTRLYLSLTLYLTFFFYTINAQDYNVLNFNAVGDGKTDDTKAVRAALAAAKNSNGGRVIFPSGYTFLTGCFNLTDNVILDVQGTILASLDVKNYEIIPKPIWIDKSQVKQPVIFSYNATNLTITGGGVIDGNGPYWYACMYNATVEPCYPYGRPHLLQPQYSSNIRVENITLKDSPSWTLHLAWTTNVYINNVTIVSPIGTAVSKADGWNTDGIDIDCSVNVTVENCIINTADDAVVVKSGQDYYGRTYGRTSENIMVRNLNVGYSNGLCVGSETSAGARNVTFRDSIVNGSYRAIFIKSQIGRGGTVEDITFTNISVYNTNVTIELSMLYNGNISSDGGDTSIPIAKNIIITNITADNVEYFWNIKGINESHFQNVYFSNIHATNIYKQIVHNCYFISGICDDSTVKPYCPPCLVHEECFDASNDCSIYANLCHSPAYHNTMCDLCRKTCGLCQSC